MSVSSPAGYISSAAATEDCTGNQSKFRGERENGQVLFDVRPEEHWFYWNVNFHFIVVTTLDLIP